MRGTALLLALMVVAAPVTAQEITAGAAVQPSTESRVETPPPSRSSDVEVPESLKVTLRLLRTPGLHPELSEVLGLDEAVSLSVLQASDESSQEEDEGLPGWAWALIGIGIGVGVFFLLFAYAGGAFG